MTLILPRLATPSNLHIPGDMQVDVLESDMYDICNRIKDEVEGGDRLFINVLKQGDKVAYAIMERTDDRGDMLVMKVGPSYDIDALDARVLTKLRYMLSKPLAQRYRELELEQERAAAREHQEYLERMWEEIGGPMRHDLYNCGFIDSLGVSAPLNNRAARRARGEYRRANPSRK